ncbi:hypothetical protein [Leptothoe spongobia]|uniref:Uncharacterized protein n=1 Tax=Leptothoe spongobia TAU-MAC 1115 TaxID=1967444 RepID=A0A947DCS3_9CYAN|nr:hypothetical protein [Leptothoe spongobia]MBT9314662.1 hypothetical protein [Leptothoe spongobia TAU-MAC 1115]
MTWQELQSQALHLPIDQRWYLVQALLASIQQETHQPQMTAPSSKTEPISNLDSWTQRLIGVIQLPPEDNTNSYVDYLEEKYS